ncbi:MAG: DUF2029 domain-containing protein, partial [Hyphomicrobiaceae bacterium]|nr:DUF2029 domain-containing protein [Hyphomicrobiaceae bacterium]
MAAHRISKDGIVAAPWTLLAIALGLTGGYGIWSISEPAPPLFSDFLVAYYDAGLRVVARGAVPTWPLDTVCTEGFVNLPVLAWLFAPLALVERNAAAWLFFTIGLVAVLAAYVLMVRRFRLADRERAYLLLAVLLNGPGINSLREGNVTHIMLLFLVLAVVLWQAGAERTMGCVLGFCAILKLPLALLGVYFLVRRRWRIVAAMAATGGLTLAASILVFGPAINVAWYHECVAPFAAKVMPGFNNQSLVAFAYRLDNGSAHLHSWFLVEPTLAVHVARAASVALAIMGAVWLLAHPAEAPPNDGKASAPTSRDLSELALVLVVAVILTPLAWSHYFVWLLLPWALGLAGLLSMPAGRLPWWLLNGGFLLSALPVVDVSTHLGALTPLWARTFVSSAFLGCATVLAALVLAVRQGAASAHGNQPMRARWVTGLSRLLRARNGQGLLPTERVTRQLALLLGAVLVINGLLWLVTPSSLGDSGLKHLGYYLSRVSDGDSWAPMAHALHYIEQEYFAAGTSRPLYTELVLRLGEKFQYPPFTLFIAATLRGWDTALGGMVYSAMFVSWMAVLLSVAGTVAILETALRRAHVTRADDPLLGPRLLVAAALCFTFYPLLKAFTLGQIQTWLNALLTLALLAWMWHRPTLSGLLVGCCLLVKPHYGLLLVWGVLRREWRFAVTGAAVFLAGTWFSIRVIGLEHHLDYVAILSHLSRHGEAFYPNQSLNGLLNRLMSLADPVAYNNLTWAAGRFPPFTLWIYVATLAAGAVLVAAA